MSDWMCGAAALVFFVVWGSGIGIAYYRGTRRFSYRPTVMLFGGLASAGYIGCMVVLGIPHGNPVWAKGMVTSVLGLASITLGGAIRVWAMIVNRFFFSGWQMPPNEEDLCARGPYRFLRHPGYAGAGVMLVGAVFLEPHTVLLMLTGIGLTGYFGLALIEARVPRTRSPSAK